MHNCLNLSAADRWSEGRQGSGWVESGKASQERTVVRNRETE